MREIPTATIASLERHFHDLIHKRASEFELEVEIDLPSLTDPKLRLSKENWFAVPGMYGGFHFWFEGEGDTARLVTESWCRVVGGSGQRHEITPNGTTLTEDGFV
ncbi:hypothetical protein [Motiliproteus sp. SC1-56]|uniref:hypothetical protein n=1 Tax=Motiliproteus sp. SC1-56 TaxID=2799565 RepID=UPI001A8D9059|nr:hypothetical protein [Motiliproteus sp. SC1-56]